MCVRARSALVKPIEHGVGISISKIVHGRDGSSVCARACVCAHLDTSMVCLGHDSVCAYKRLGGDFSNALVCSLEQTGFGFQPSTVDAGLFFEISQQQSGLSTGLQ